MGQQIYILGHTCNGPVGDVGFVASQEKSATERNTQLILRRLDK
jgi:hypothetical protein